jgi:hypothetical protein
MKFDIDLVYLDRKYRVRKIRTAMKRRRMSICFGAHSVLELPSGTIAKTGTQRGDQLALRFWELHWEVVTHAITLPG